MNDQLPPHLLPQSNPQPATTAPPDVSHAPRVAQDSPLGALDPAPPSHRGWLPFLALGFGLLLTLGIGLVIAHFFRAPPPPVTTVGVVVAPAAVEVAVAPMAAIEPMPSPPVHAPVRMPPARPKRMRAPTAPPVAEQPPPTVETPPVAESEPMPAESGPPPKTLRAYPFDVRTLKGEHFELNALKGKVVVLTLWSLGCGFCFEEVPELEQLKRQHAHDGTVFLSFASNTEPELRESKETARYPFPVVADPEGFLYDAFTGQGFPTHVVIDRMGRIVEGAVTSGAGDVVEKIEGSMKLELTAPRDLPVRERAVNEGPCSLSGQVRAVRTGKPVPLASLRLQGIGARAVRADQDGRFTFTRIGCTTYSLSAFGTGVSPHHQSVTVTESQPEPLVVSMPQLGTVEGTVVDEHGAGIAGATVGATCGMSSGTATTDSSGHFTLDDVQSSNSTALVVTPRGALLGAIVRVPMSPSETANTRVVSGAVTLAGTLDRAGGDVLVEVTPTHGWCSGAYGTISPKPDGSFSVIVPPGEYQLRPWYKESSPWAKDAPGPAMTVTVGAAGRDDVVVNLVPPRRPLNPL